MNQSIRIVFSRLMVPALCLAGIFVVLGVLYRTIPAPPPPPPKPAPKEVAAPKPEQTYEALKGQYMTMVSQGPRKLGDFKGAKYRGSEDRIKDELKVFQAWAILINEMPRYPLTDSEKELVRSVGRQLSAIQRRELPLMRAEFAKSLRQSLIKHRTMAYCSGDRKENLRVIALPGTPQEALQRCMEILMGETCAQLRFSRIDFTFTGEQTVTAPVKPTKKSAPRDGELVFWRETVYEPVEWKERAL
ncbi:MAG: hypothetical protein EHM23_36050 [Acidobacteria bacterium]|nr:MAG: hypothetical protein EHM23_36050 [Acidobacteriota bacterium]